MVCRCAANSYLNPLQLSLGVWLPQLHRRIQTRRAMRSIDLNSISYRYRSNGASLLLSKANRLSGTTGRPTDQKSLLAAVAYYDMALSLMRPFDPNYVTVVNWKCNALIALGQFEQAVSWYHEIIRISDQTDGKAGRNATAALAEQRILAFADRRDEAIDLVETDATDFEDPPYCMAAEGFCRLLVEKQFKKAHEYLSPTLKATVSVAGLKAEWVRLIQEATPKDVSITLEQHRVDWPGRKAEDIGWCYFAVVLPTVSEGVTVVVGRAPHNGLWLTEVTFGRP